MDAFLNALPAHKAGLHLAHNNHIANGTTVAQDVAQGFIAEGEWVSPEEKMKAVETNEMWSIWWYPEDPLSFRCYYASTLEALMQKVAEG